MNNTYNVYCDESCHLEHDHQPVMVLGAVWCPLEAVAGVSEELAMLRRAHHMAPGFEAKWTKISPGGRDFYLDLVNLFFREGALHFRGLVIPDKVLLDHDKFGQTHDAWYYKMYFDMLKAILDPLDTYRIYLDLKDSRGAEKVRKLHEVLCNSMYDFDCKVVERVQQVRSHEVPLLQIADLLVGAVMCANRQQKASAAKTAVMERVRRRSSYLLTKTTLLRENKFNLLVWRPSQES